MIPSFTDISCHLISFDPDDPEDHRQWCIVCHEVRTPGEPCPHGLNPETVWDQHVPLLRVVCVILIALVGVAIMAGVWSIVR